MHAQQPSERWPASKRRPWQRQPQRRPRQRSLHETTRSGPWSARSRESACTQHSAIGSARRGCSRSPCARTCSSAHSAASLCGDGDDDGGHLRRERCRFQDVHGACAAETRGVHGARAGRCRPELQRRGNSLSVRVSLTDSGFDQRGSNLYSVFQKSTACKFKLTPESNVLKCFG